ncbi:hypothetical protein BSKO_02382 [Bryopsis sp. KO-2023]|nr:hypothetical protein BSKO_02382 [Bryopsis sp. KO-2023]
MSAAQWEDVPDLALGCIFLRVGLPSLTDAFLVCKSWCKVHDQEGFWRGVVKREFGAAHEKLPKRMNSWKRYAQFLHQQKTYLIELGPNAPTLLCFEDEMGVIRRARGLMDAKIVKVVDGARAGGQDLFCGTCITAAGEILLWLVHRPTQLVKTLDASNSYTAPFKGKSVVSDLVQDRNGALVLTQEGDLFETRSWPSVPSENFHVEFDQVPVPSRVVSFALCCAGVRAAVLDDGCVYVWGEVKDSLFEGVGTKGVSLFGLGPECPFAVRTDSATSIPTPQKVAFDSAAASACKFVEIVAGKAHFLTRSNSGDVWAWGFGGLNKKRGRIEITSSPIRAARNIRKLHNGSMMECTGGNFYAYLEFVCGGETRPIWTPMYNFQYDLSSKPCSPNAWPWVDGELGVVRAHSREISEMPLESPVPMSNGCIGFSKQNAGCIRVHVCSDEECQTWSDPVQVSPMFDIGPGIFFGVEGNMYFGSQGRIVVKDIRRPFERDQFYLVDLQSLGIRQELFSVHKPCGGLLLALVGPNY